MNEGGDSDDDEEDTEEKVCSSSIQPIPLAKVRCLY